MKGINIGKLKEKLLNIYEENFVEQTIEIRNNLSKLISQIHTLADVIEKKYEEDIIRITYRADKSTVNKINNLVKETAAVEQL
jgi:50S ribosomal subunit-associated GTPase HflX